MSVREETDTSLAGIHPLIGCTERYHFVVQAETGTIPAQGDWEVQNQGGRKDNNLGSSGRTKQESSLHLQLHSRQAAKWIVSTAVVKVCLE